MQDDKIVDLYFARDEQAIAATSAKYNTYCMNIAMNILHNREDSEECVNDTLLAAWNSIPPHRPENLSAFLGKLTRNFSLNRHKANHAERRGGGEFALSLEELDECIEDPRTLTDNAEELGKIISEFLYTQPQEMRKVFVRRYFHSESISDIADYYDMSESKVKSILHRMRLSLRTHLTEHEIHI
ncbi:MAG: sigma-70 family RNA polymerase sigma factor [Clostridia bacterium]|jgi:RNA polymerase sigma-70 factor (ECF subfamily)|nr:sigma-70 family RNA polymerase sigma factor [Clostridia bacterium]